MHSYDIPEFEASIIDHATDDVFAESKSIAWSPLKLSLTYKTVWAVHVAQGIIDNGGFQYFFENDWPDKPPYSIFIDSFRSIGADEGADCLQDAVKMFPFADPHLDFDARRDFMAVLREKSDECSSEMDLLGERLIDLGGETFMALCSFITANLVDFPSAKKVAEQVAASDR